MAERTPSSKSKQGPLAALVLLLLLLLLLLGGLLAWAFMRLNNVEDSVNGKATTNVLNGTGTGGTTTSGGSGSTSGGTGSGSTTNTTRNTTGGSGGSGSGSTTTIECPPPAERVSLPDGTDVCVTIDPFPSINTLTIDP